MHPDPGGQEITYESGRIRIFHKLMNNSTVQYSGAPGQIG
jgi:hypothetical protein